MIRGYRPRWFTIEELVPPETIAALGRDRAWLVLDPRALVTLDQLREQFGPFTINTWHAGGDLRYCGFRPRECDVGAEHSQHRYGRAFDCHLSGTSPEMARAQILCMPDKFPYLTTMEANTETWIHVDVREFDGLGIQLVHP